MKKQNRFKSSIKWRFTFIFMGLIAVLFIAILLANSFLLEGYYTIRSSAASSLPSIVSMVV